MINYHQASPVDLSLCFILVVFEQLGNRLSNLMETNHSLLVHLELHISLF